ncbi:MAG: LpqB family beta-propeller domain-containing protein [Candidatus Solibacter sp.]
MPAKKLVQRPAVMLALALCSVGGLVTLMGRFATGPQVAQKKTQITNGDSTESYPALSPDGKRLAYSARESSKVSAYHIFVRELPNGKPLQLTKAEDSDIGPVWAPDGGTLAFLRVGDDNTQAIVIPADGGVERKIADLGPAANAAQPEPAISWNPDGKSLVAVQTAGEKQLPGLAILGIDSGKLERITNPTEGTEGDSAPAVSLSGSTIAFVRHSTSGADIFLCDAKGQGVRRLTFDDSGIRGLAWTRDEQDILYAGNRVGGWHLWRVPAYGGSPRDLAASGRQANYPSIGKNRMVYADSPTVAAIWRAPLSADEGAEGRPLIRSTGREQNPVWSPDGARIANVSDQTGADEIFVTDASGENRIQVTHLNSPRIGRIAWSADSKTLVYDTSGERGQEVYTIAAAAGAKPTRVLLRANSATFSHDGKSIYFLSQGQVWKATNTGGNPQSLSDERAGQPSESADGKWLYFRGHRSIWRIPAAGGELEEAFVPERESWGNSSLQVTSKGIYYTEFERSSRSPVISFYDFAAKKSSLVFHVKSGGGGRGGAFAISPDGKSVLYGRVDQSQTNIMLIDNFR